jgi:futalosine hydrolase
MLCAATHVELSTFGLIGVADVEPGVRRVPEGIAVVTGVGVPITLLRLVPWLERYRPEWIALTGIAGAYAESGLRIGDIVVGETEEFADLGMEFPEPEAGGFAPLADFPFADEAHRTPLALHLPAWASELRRGRGATVNTCTGTDATGARRRARFGADFETMEGAAVALAARTLGIPVIQVRAVSNLAARRDMRPENIAVALESLRAFWMTARPKLSQEGVT